MFEFTRAFRCAAALGGASLALLLAGCGSSLNPIDGQVVWSDTGAPAKELEGAQVTFELPEKNTSSIGIVQPDGSFQVMTAKPNDGAYAGIYTVTISERRQSAGGELMAPTKADIRYADRANSKLKAEVKPGRNKLVLKIDRTK